MPEASGSPSGRRLADDLRRIREARGITVADLHDETKIPLALLENFERTALFDHPQFNRVYLRSFVRTYAQVLGISAEVALEALEDALDGKQSNRLAVEYLGEAPAQPPPAVPPITEAPAETPPAEPPLRKEPAADAPAAPPRRSAPAPAEDWSATSPPGRRPANPAPAERVSAPERRRPAGRRPNRLPVVIGVGVVVVAGLAWLVIALTNRSGGDAPAVVAADTAAVRPETTAVARPALRDPGTIPTLGDTMHVVVVAAGGKLSPVRVTVDDDLRRPYWLEQGDSMRFRPRQRIVVEEQLENVRLMLLGERYPTNRLDPQGRIVITRDSAQTFLQALASQPPPDTTAAP